MANQAPTQRAYLIRRLILLAVVIGIIWGIVALIGAAVGAIQGAFANPSPSSSQGQPSNGNGANGTGTNSGGSGGGSNSSTHYTTCMPAGLSLLAVVGDGSKPQSSFAAGSNPKLWFTLTNTSGKPCYFNVGTAAQQFIVTSGSEKIWTTTDCKAAKSNYRMLLQPGAANASTPITWARVRSSSTGCDAASGQSAAIGGGASYHLTVKLGPVTSNDVQFILQ
jgi:hypothetical protein